MGLITIKTSNTSGIREGEELVYGGKNGFVSELGAIPIICSSLVSNVNSITLTLNNLHLLVNSSTNKHILEEIDSYYGIKVPIYQYKDSISQEGTVGFNSSLSNNSLFIRSYNLQANTITVDNYQSNGTYISDYVVAPPFYTRLYQNVNSNLLSSNTIFVAGSLKPIKKSYNVEGITGFYTVKLPVETSINSELRAFIDDTISTITLDNSSYATVSVPDNSNTLDIYIDFYTVPSVEVGDKLSFCSCGRTYTVTSATYQPSSGGYNSSLTANKFYSVTLDKSLPIISSGTNFVNITPDFTGKVQNVTSNSFSMFIDPKDYSYTYELANNKIYYVYQKNKVKYTTARLDEFGRLPATSPGKYIVQATTLNRYNRASPTVKSFIEIEPLKIPKVSGISVEESIFIDTTGGAFINALVSFNSLIGADVTEYIVEYRVVSDDVTPSEFSKIAIPHVEGITRPQLTINNLTRGRVVGSNTLELKITPAIASTIGYPTRYLHTLVGKQAKPSGIKNLSAAQLGENILFSWNFETTSEGYILDLDNKEVELRVYTAINENDPDIVNVAWGLANTVERLPFPSTSAYVPITRFGTYSYLFRVRDTSDNESDTIVAYTLTTKRPDNIKVYKSYNEKNPGVSFIVQDGQPFPTSNIHPEVNFPSFSESITSGLVQANSSNTDNANGSSVGFTMVSESNNLSTGVNKISQYITPIRDVGQLIRGTLRINPITVTDTIGFTYSEFHETVLSGVTDSPIAEGVSNSGNCLVDISFGGIGHILGYNNTTAATVSYNAYHRTLTSGGSQGNVYAIRNPGQFDGDYANTNAYALIAGVISMNAIALGDVYYANGVLSSSNIFSNVTASGNSYELINLYQYGDSPTGVTFLGPSRSILQNVLVRYATSNVYYDAAANNVIGFPNHGNTNPNVFIGASSNAEYGWKSYLPGDNDFRYFQIKIDYKNDTPDLARLALEEFTYEVDIKEKSFNTKVLIDNPSGILLDYSHVNFYEPPSVVCTLIDYQVPASISATSISNNNCIISAVYANSIMATSVNVSVVVRGI